MVERGYTQNEENRIFEEKASKIFGKSRINPFPNKKFGREWTERHNIKFRTFGYQALKHWEEEFDEVKKRIVLGLNATENQLNVNNGDLLLEEVDYWSVGEDSLMFLKTNDNRKNRNFYILLSNKKGGDQAYVIDRREGSENTRINYFPDGVQLKDPEYRTSYISKDVPPTESVSEYWLELTEDLKTIGREDILPPVSEEWSNYDLGI
jgi:hypothetical protein